MIKFRIEITSEKKKKQIQKERDSSEVHEDQEARGIKDKDKELHNTPKKPDKSTLYTLSKTILIIAATAIVTAVTTYIVTTTFSIEERIDKKIDQYEQRKTITNTGFNG